MVYPSTPEQIQPLLDPVPSLSALRRVLKQAAGLNALTVALSAATTPAEVAQAVIVQGHRALGAYRGAVYLLDDAGTGLQMIGSSGYAPELEQGWRQLPLSRQIPLTEAVRTGEIILLGSFESQRQEYPTLPPSETQAFAAIPLRIGDRTLGGLNFSFRERQRFVGKDRALMYSLGQHCAQALERARLFEAERQARDETEALAEINRHISSSIDRVTVLQSIVDSARALLRADIARLALVQDGALRVVASSGAQTDKALGLRIQRGVGLNGLVLERGTPLQTANYQSDPAIRRSPDVTDAVLAEGTVSILGVPVLHAGECTAVLWLAQRSPRVFSPREIALLERLGGQSAVAIANAETLERERRARAESDALADISRRISSSLDLPTVLQAVADSARELLSADMVDIGLLSVTGILTTAAASGSEPSRPIGREIPPGVGITAQVLGHLRSYQVEDYKADARIRHDPNLDSEVQRVGIRSMLAVPILDRGEANGVLWLYQQTKRVYEPREVELVERLAAQAAIAIANARTLDQERQARAEAEALAEISRGISASLDLDALLQAVADSSRSLLNGDMADIALLDPEGELIIAATSGPRPTPAIGLKMPSGTGVGGWVLQHRRAFQVADYLGAPGIHRRPDLDEMVRARGIRAMLAVPVLHGEEGLGVVRLVQRTPRVFDSREVALLERLAAQAAIAIANARMLAQERQARAEAEALLGASAQLNTHDDPEQALRVFVALAMRLLNAERGGYVLTAGSGFGGLSLLHNGSWEIDEYRPGPDSLIGHVWSTGEPYRTSSPAIDPYSDLQRKAESRPRSLLAVPLTDDLGGRLGVVVLVNSPHPDGFSERDERLLTAFCAYGAAVARRAAGHQARLEAEFLAQQRSQELKSLLGVMERLNGAKESDEVLRALLLAVTERLELHGAVITLAEADCARIWGGWVDGAWFSSDRLVPLDGSVTGWVLRHGRPYRTDDVRTDPLVHRSDESAGLRGPLLAVPIRDSTGKAVGVLHLNNPHDGRSFTDEDQRLCEVAAEYASTALHRAALTDELARRASELDTVLNNLTDALYVVDPAGRITLTNRVADQWAAEENPTILAGKSVGGLIAAGREISNLRMERLDGTPLEASDSAAMRALHGEYIQGSIYRIWRTDQERYIYRRSVAGPILDANGEIAGAVVVTRDVTESYLAEQEARQTERMRATGQLAAGMAHDLNNVLGVALGRMDIVLEQDRLVQAMPVPMRGSLGIVRQALLDAAESVRRLQTFARGHATDTFTTVDLREVVHGAIELARPRWQDEAMSQGRTIRLEERLRPTPPIRGNAAELREAILNLIVNAVDALPSGGTIIAETRRERGNAVLGVSDTGTGMSEDVMSRAWDPFYTTKLERGTGLGLAMVQAIVARHNGQATLQSEPGRGTDVSLSFPPTTEQAAPAVAPARESSDSIRVLVVDDEDAVRLTVVAMLELLGQHAVEAASGSEALRLLEKELFGLVLTDHGMPNMTGLDLAALIHTRWPDTPVVLVTGWGDTFSEERVHEDAGSKLAGKPLTLEKLRGLLSWAADESSTRAKLGRA